MSKDNARRCEVIMNLLVATVLRRHAARIFSSMFGKKAAWVRYLHDQHFQRAADCWEY